MDLKFTGLKEIKQQENKYNAEYRRQNPELTSGFKRSRIQVNNA
jgi:hypothetical protein